jgi:hypothetical protein
MYRPGGAVRIQPMPSILVDADCPGQDSDVAAFVRKLPQPREFRARVTELMLYLLPHYVQQGKSYLTVAFGWDRLPAPQRNDGRRDEQEAGYQAVHQDTSHPPDPSKRT